MDGVKVLASGFDMDEKVNIEKLVIAMGGILSTKASPDTSFIIAKNVLAAKYKWALNVLKKPVVTVKWLYQCWNEHRIVPQESYRVLPFSGLVICVTRVAADERKEIEKLAIQNGGKYSGELTKKCTHLISDAPEGDKYKVARRWGHIHIVTRKWFDQSVIRRACLNEEHYPVNDSPASSNKKPGSALVGSRNTASMLASAAADSYVSAFPSARGSDPDLEATLSQNMSCMFTDPPVFLKEESDALVPEAEATSKTNLECLVANDSQSEDNDLYLSDCRISLVGFESSELRKLIHMVRRGGGSRYMSLNDKLTHIIVGCPSEIEKKELRSIAASGVIYVVRPIWLEDCSREKVELPVERKHIGYDLLLPKGSMNSTIRGGAAGTTTEIDQGKDSNAGEVANCGQVMEKTSSCIDMLPVAPVCKYTSPVMGQSDKSLLPIIKDHVKNKSTLQFDSGNQNVQKKKLSIVFLGKRFCFSKSFPEDRKAEIVEWVNQGGGMVVGDHEPQNVHFTIECHGTAATRCSGASQNTTSVSSHWVRSCLEDGCLLDIRSHIIYSPLPCSIPFPGFEKFRFCVSQYEEKERLLLRNLCFVLGAKFVEKLTKKVTHLLCKFANGPKYDAASKWGICSITCEWLYHSILQNQVVEVDSFRPKEVTSVDQEDGLCTVSQFPTQCTTESQEQAGTCNPREVAQPSGADWSKRQRIMEHDDQLGLVASMECHLNNNRSTNSKCIGESQGGMSDVAAAIEDLLEQTSKIHEQASSAKTNRDEDLFSSNCSMLGGQLESCLDAAPSVSVLPRNWLNRRARRREDASIPPWVRKAATHDGFSETQTESQVVGYDDDVSGRQMLIERVRTRSSMA